MSKHKSGRKGVTAILYSEQKRGWFQKMTLTPSQLTLLGFALFIFIGMVLLRLPIAVAEPYEPSLLTALFTSTSAVCVTGLNVINPVTYFTLFGQLVVMFLIQIGGLGYMMMYSLMLLAVGRRLSLRDHMALQEVMDMPGSGGVQRFILQVLRFTLIIEGIGAFLLACYWVPQLGWSKGLYYSIFHAISAFNNAGFALFSTSFIEYQDNSLILLVISFLVILGGLGYPVLSELTRKIKQRDLQALSWRVLSINTKLGLLSTAILLGGATLLIYAFEANNPQTLGNMPWYQQLLTAFFHSAMPRTAGFNAVDLATLSHVTLFLMVTLMFIGTNPGGTGGGVKTTTIVAIGLQTFSILRGRPEVNVQQRRINMATLNKASATIFLSLMWITFVCMSLQVIENKPFLELLFETVSAFGTVGLSVNLTPTLAPLSQLLLIATMFAGRVGLLTIGTAIWWTRHKSVIKYAEEGLLVG